MSGPVTTLDVPTVDAEVGRARPPCTEIGDDRVATVGRVRVRRALPRRHRRTVGAWCFADHLGPAEVTERSSVDIGPHPHIGLQTVTWVIDGEVLHRDSLGSEQVIRPGQLNLMTAGEGVSHSEEATGGYRGRLHGLQLWLAQPDRTRGDPAAFDHHPVLPQVSEHGAVLTVLVGEFEGVTSPARHDTPLMGVDVDMRTGAYAWPLRPEFEHALLVLTGELTLQGCRLRPGQLAYLGRGRTELAVDAGEPTRAVVLGGVPFDEPILMWWHFVARTRVEIEAATLDWNESDRFGRVASGLPRIPAPPLPWRGRPAEGPRGVRPDASS